MASQLTSRPATSAARAAPASPKRTAPTAPKTEPLATPAPRKEGAKDRPFLYVLAFLVFTGLAIAGVWRGNQIFAPEMYSDKGPRAFADAFAKKLNYATFDLNINIREMRDKQIKDMVKTPEIVVLGASHWQEAHTELLPQLDFYNAHVHRDYYEDMLGMVEMFVRHDRLPKKMIIAIRDRLFTPVADRTDFLWLPGIPYYEAMAGRLGFEPHSRWETAPYQRWRELTSVSMLYNNVTRWYKAPVKPHATAVDHHETLDTLRPGGSIYWSKQHQDFFTQERSRRLSLEFAKQNFPSPPKIDPIGVKTLDRLFAYLKDKGVEVYFVHPPFNPIYFDAVKNSPYKKGLRKIEELTQNYAKKYGFKSFGSFDPADFGCKAEDYIDAEHANPHCLGKFFNKFAEKYLSKPPPVPEREFEPEPEAVELPSESQQDNLVFASASAEALPPAKRVDPVAQKPTTNPVNTSAPVENRRGLPPLPVPGPWLADAACVAPGIRFGSLDELRRFHSTGQSLINAKNTGRVGRIQ